MLGVLLAAFALTGCKSSSPSQYISPRVEGRVLDAQSHAPISGVEVLRVVAGGSSEAGDAPKGGQLLERTPHVTTGKDGSFILESARAVAFFQTLGWYTINLSFDHPAYQRFPVTFKLSDAVNTAKGEPVVKAGDILLTPLSGRKSQ
jgi:hypothetical protein